MLRCEAQGNCAGVFYIFLSCLCKFRSQKYTTLPGLVIQGQPSLKPEQIGIMAFQNLLLLHINAVWSQNNCCAFGWILICCYSSCLSIHCQNRTHLIVYIRHVKTKSAASDICQASPYMHSLLAQIMLSLELCTSWQFASVMSEKKIIHCILLIRKVCRCSHFSACSFFYSVLPTTRTDV